LAASANAPAATSWLLRDGELQSAWRKDLSRPDRCGTKGVGHLSIALL
jgi:hypothetical protein